MSSIILGVPSAVLELNQKGLLERAFHDGLFPNLAYRAEALAEEWPANSGQELFMSRPGLLPTVTQAMQPGTDPLPQAIPFEQWSATLGQYVGTIDTHMPTSNTANANLFLRNLHQLGLQAGQSINQIARNAMFQSYLSGQTVAIASISSGDTQVRIAALNGFTDVCNPGLNVRPQPVSAAYPLAIKIGSGGAAVSASVIGYVPDDPTDAMGPGTLQLAAAVGAGFAARVAVKSAYAPRVIRSAAGDSVDAITAGDTITMQQAINAVAILRRANVQPHEDGLYHAHISPIANSQFFADPVFQRLNQSLPNGMAYSEGFVGSLSGIAFFMNNESPELTNSGKLTATASSGVYAQGIGSEVVNGGGTNIGRCIITGKGSIYERYIDESAYVTEAGVTGKIGEFSVTNNGLNILTERIRLVLRAPQDRLQQTVSASWSISTSFPMPSDITAPSGPERFKRAVVLEFANGS